MIQNTVYFVLKGVDYFLQTRNEAKDLHVSRIFFKLGGLSGAAALSMAAYHEVAFRANDESNTREHLTKIFETGNKMHVVNSVALLCAPCYGRPYFTGTLLTAGILLFSGSCYVHALTGNTTIKYVIPYGRVVLIFAWLSMLF